MRTRAGPSRLRLAIYTMACVVLGLATTLGIAWACAAWVNAAGAVSVFSSTQLTKTEVEELERRESQGTTSLTATNINIFVPSAPQERDDEDAVAYRTQTTQRAFGHTRINQMTSDMRFDVQNGSILVGGGSGKFLRLGGLPYCEAVDQAGWPFRALECSMPTATISTANVSMTISSGPSVLAGGISLPPDASGRWRALPYRPRWFGLLGNIVVFGALWFGVLLAPGIVRRRKRRTRGECIACGYDLRGGRSARCPECGYSTGITMEDHGETGSDEEQAPKMENAETPKSVNVEMSEIDEDESPDDGGDEVCVGAPMENRMTPDGCELPAPESRGQEGA